MALRSDELSIYEQRYKALMRFNDSHNALVNDLLIYSHQLETVLRTETSSLRGKLSDAQLDLEDAKSRRRQLQQTVQSYEARVEQLTRDIDSLKNRHPYVAVLIDGDGLLFHESYINDGLEGGKRAAHALRAAVAEACGDLAPKAEIVVKVCTNLSGLAQAMRYAGCIGHESVLRQFAQGFTQSKASFDFIDVGHGKERADSKIREDARWHLHNPNCKLVMLGIAHDSGYAPFLDELRSDPGTLQRLRILEGSPATRELVSTNIEIINMNKTVFRPDKIVASERPALAPHGDNSSSYNNGGSSYNAGPAATNGAAANGNGGGGVGGKGKDKPPGPAKTSPPALVVAPFADGPRPASAAPAAPAAGAGGGKAPASVRAPPSLSFPAATTKSLQQAKAAAAAHAAAQLLKKKPKWDPGKRGLDPAVSANPGVIESIKARREGEKFCNSHILLGYCSNYSCPYNHDLKATPDEKKALAYMSRISPCTAGQDCGMDDCLYGHHCPSAYEGVCTFSRCRFPKSLHAPNTKYTKAAPEY